MAVGGTAIIQKATEAILSPFSRFVAPTNQFGLTQSYALTCVLIWIIMISIKHPLCFLGLHKLSQIKVYAGREEWVRKTHCTRCKHIESEEKVTWLSMESQTRLDE
jgi:hypothetical protein